MNSNITLQEKECKVTIHKGELVSFFYKNEEYIHQKGNKGWSKSDDEMFPIIGPTSKNNFKVHTKKGDAIQDQHGFLRELDYALMSSDEHKACFIKNYKKNTQVKNSKFPKKSSEPFLNWPFDFTFQKNVSLLNNKLTIEFIITTEKKMLFMLGYHPAFLLSNSGKEIFLANDKTYNLTEVYKAGSNAFPILNCNQIILQNIDKKNLEITTEGFNNFMLWTEVDNMVCIEPITQYTSYTDQKFSEENMKLSKGIHKFSVDIKVIE